jgi:hypothetical protein
MRKAAAMGGFVVRLTHAALGAALRVADSTRSSTDLLRGSSTTIRAAGA